MRKMMKWALACALCILIMSCSDSLDSGDGASQQPNAAEEIAKETFIHEEWMDRSVKPGDSFWDFALGTWLKGNEMNGPMMSIGLSGPVILGKALNDYHGNNHMVQLIRGPRPSIEDQVAVIDNVLARLNLNDDATKADVMRNTGILADLGFCALLGHHVAVIDGILRYDIIPGIYSLPKVETSTKEDYLKSIKEFCENSLGMDLSKPENVKLAEAVVDIDRWMRELLLKWKNTDPIPAIVGNGGWTPLASDPVPAKSFLASADTRGSGGDDMRDAFAEAFHIDENTYCQTEVNQVFDFLNNFDAKTLNFYLKYYVVANLNNFIYKPEHSAENFLSFIAFSSHSILLDYEKEVFLKGSDCEGARSMLEEMRTLFAQRIQNSTWLSEDTKTQALKKLQNMKFLLGAPERIFNADFKLTGKSPVEDLVQYRGFCDEYLRNVLPGLRGADYQWEYVMLSPIGMGLSAGNAFYDPSTNQLCILPAFLGEEMFPKDKNDIFRYITGWVFAHEMTHGFDGNGAKYDYEGKEADWWKPEDKAKFEKLKQMMVARYNELEQIPGVPANGELTKNENIADLGGMTLAYAVWNNKLKADGLTGEQLRHQQRQFFLEAAHLWQGKPTEEMLLNSLNSDVHSASHNRVNGIVRLMDEWYDLFGVQPDEKLYVKPEDRVKIW